MKIVYLLGFLNRTGGSIVLYKFMDLLVEKGHSVYVVTPQIAQKWQVGFGSQILKEQFSIEENGFKGMAKQLLWRVIGKRFKQNIIDSDAWFYHRYIGNRLSKAIINNYQHSIKTADVLVATYSLTAYAAFCLSSSAGKIFYHMQHYEEVFFPHSDLKRKAVRLTYFMPFRLIANSTWLRNIMINICRRPADLLCPGIDTDVYYPYEHIENKYSVTPKCFTIVAFVDKDRPFKGSNDLIEAMKLVWNKLGRDRVKLKLFGFAAPDDLKKENVEHLGFLQPSELAKLYSSAYLFVLSSWYESFPLQPIEAMSCGTAVVTTRIGTEDYAVDGQNSFVVAPENPAEMSRKIIELLANKELCLKFAQNGINTSREYSWDKKVKELEDIFQNVSADRVTYNLDMLVSGLFKGNSG